MALVPLNLPPGVWRNGTTYQAKGRYYDCNLVRWYEGTLRPWGGWVAYSATTTGAKTRGMVGWVDSSGRLWIVAGTAAALYVYDAGAVRYTITPAGLTAGRDDAAMASGYGGGAYGAGTYGDGRSGSTLLLAATVWTMDTLEQNPVFCNVDDGKIYSWDLDVTHVAAQCSGSPTACRAVFVTQEGFIFALGAGGDPRNIQWPDQSSFTAWTPSASNMARSYALQTPGHIMCGCRFKDGAVIFTTTDVHLATFIGLPLVYSFTAVGSDCGIVSQAAYATSGDIVAWMGLNSFWVYDGTVRALESDVGDYVFSRLNAQQRSKIHAVHNATFGEMTWFYPSTGTEIDSYVTWNYRENHWAVGSLVRLCGMQAGIITNPVMIDAAGKLWTHESGFAYNSEGTAYAETGPIEVDQTVAGATLQGLHNGTRTYDILQMYPDSSTLGDVVGTFYTRLFPTGSETAWGPYSMANPTSLRIAARQTRLRFTSNSASDWRLGVPRLEFAQAGER